MVCRTLDPDAPAVADRDRGPARPAAGWSPSCPSATGAVATSGTAHRGRAPRRRAHRPPAGRRRLGHGRRPLADLGRHRRHRRLRAGRRRRGLAGHAAGPDRPGGLGRRGDDDRRRPREERRQALIGTTRRAGGAATLALGQAAPDAEALVVRQRGLEALGAHRRNRSRRAWPRGSSRPSRGRTPRGPSRRTARPAARSRRPSGWPATATRASARRQRWCRRARR